MMFSTLPKGAWDVDLSYQVLKIKPGCGAFLTFPKGP